MDLKNPAPAGENPSSLPVQTKNLEMAKSIIIIVVTSIIVGGSVYFLQEQKVKKIESRLQTEIKTLQGSFKAIETERNDLKSQIEEVRAEKENVEKLSCKGLWKDGVCLKSACVDSDSNEKPNDIYVKGSVTVTDENGIATVTYDECSGSRLQVNEMWCYESPAGSGNYIKGQLVYNCPKGCLDGACIK